MTETATETRWTDNAPEVAVGDRIRVLSDAPAREGDGSMTHLAHTWTGIEAVVTDLYEGHVGAFAVRARAVDPSIRPDEQYLGHYEVIAREGETEADRFKARLISFGLEEHRASEMTTTGLGVYDQSDRTSAARWVGEHQPYVKRGDIIQVGTDRFMVAYVEPDNYASGLPVYCVGPDGSVTWYRSWSVVERWEDASQSLGNETLTPEAIKALAWERIDALAGNSARTNFFDWPNGDENATWFDPNDHRPVVKVGDIVRAYDDVRAGSDDRVVTALERNNYTGFQRLGTYRANGRGDFRWLTQWDLVESWTPSPDTVRTVPVTGDRVTITPLTSATDVFIEFARGREFIYVGQERDGTRHRVRLPDDVTRDQIPERLSILYGRTDISAATVTLVQPSAVTPVAPVEPDWKERFATVLSTLDREAVDRDWCSEYEEAMDTYFDIMPDARRKQYDVWVRLSRTIDPEDHLSPETVFGSGAESEDLSCSDRVTMQVTVQVTVDGDMERPDDDAVKDALDNMDLVFDDWDIDDYNEA